MRDDPFVRWFDALVERHEKNLKFSEIRRGVQAVSSLYVSRRDRLDRNAALDGAGKRAAFAMFFGPLHFLLTREIVRALDAKIPQDATIVDLGCGTGVAGAAWALEQNPVPKVIGFDRSAWALEECKWTYRQFGINGTAKGVDIDAARLPRRSAIIAAFTINEVDEAARARFREEFAGAAKTGVPVLVIEPIARRLTTWWDDWAEHWKASGGREDEWRFRVPLPERLALMDKAAGLDHRELTGRSLWLPSLT